MTKLSADLIEEFLASYQQCRDEYDLVGIRVADELRTALDSEGVRAIVTTRSKSMSRLRSKAVQRAERKGYAQLEDFYADITDLAGVRVALYFPAQREHVAGVIGRLFDEAGARTDYPQPRDGGVPRRFSGYSAAHFRVRLRPDSVGAEHTDLCSRIVEIQVASVLMHAWAEVEHDLVYKPLSGELSAREHALLDQLNGLVQAGEISLEQLQEAGDSRVSQADHAFSNHYELGAHLLDTMAERVGERAVDEAGLGQVDLLFHLLGQWGLRTPGDLAPYLDHVHTDWERRPLCQQVIDQLLGADPSRYAAYLTQLVRADQWTAPRPTMASFMDGWAQLEQAVAQLRRDGRLPEGWRRAPERYLVEAGMLDTDSADLLRRLRVVRNRIVHGRQVAQDPLGQDVDALRTILEQVHGRLASHPHDQDDARGPAAPSRDGASTGGA